MTSQRTLKIKFDILRGFVLFITVLGLLTVFAASAIAQNPVPFIDQPLVPDAAAPGGPGFTLTVNGAGFVTASVVNWNGSPLATTFISSAQLTATVPASDIATASSAAVTVVNPKPGGVSDAQFFSIAVAETSVSFAPAVTYSSGGNLPASLVVADVNGDGIPDIIVGNYGGPAPNSVGVLLGNGDGTFQPALLIYVASLDSEPNAVAVADVNGDGKPDLVLAACCESNGDAEAAVLFGNGDGTFQAPVFYDTGGSDASALAVADVNGDGKPDIVITNWNNATLGVLLGNGNGTFQPALISAGPWDPGCLTIADVNNDGKPDALICGSFSVNVLLGNGDGTFQPVTSFSTGGCTTNVAVADVNGDGLPDMVASNAGPGGCGSQGFAAILLGNGNGTFQPEVNYLAINYTNIGVGGVAVADLNADNKLDVMVTSGWALYGLTPGTVGVLLGNGDGTFQTAEGFLAGGTQTSPIAVADLNNDGRPDIVVTNLGPNFGQGTVGVLLNKTGEPTATTLTSSLNPSNYGQTVMFTAAVTASAGTPTGTVIFYDSSAAIGSATLAGGSASISVSSLAAGSQPITAAYQGSGGFAPSTSAVLTQVVNGVATATTITSSPDPSSYGQTVTFTAAVTSSAGTPTGTVIFYDSSAEIGSATLSGGSASISVSSLTAGSQPITAAYQGSGALAPSTSAVLNQVVNPATTTTALASSLNPSIFGQPLTFTAVVSSTWTTPTGTVIFYDSSTAIGSATLVGGSASISVSSLTAGSQPITAAYQGSGDFVSSTSAPLNQVVNQAITTTSVASSANPARVKQRITYWAFVTSQYGGGTTGTVTFQDSGATIATVKLSGNWATYNTKYKTAGVHSITAAYSGDLNNVGSMSSTLTEDIYDSTKMVVTTSGSPSMVGQPVTFTATVTPTQGAIPDGELVTFYNYKAEIGTGTTASGVATFTTSSLKAGTHHIKAT